jgi:hypothetical protein
MFAMVHVLSGLHVHNTFGAPVAIGTLTYPQGRVGSALHFHGELMASLVDRLPHAVAISRVRSMGTANIRASSRSEIAA